MIHELKCRQPFWDDVNSHRKMFEARNDDRNFKVGDTLILKEVTVTGTRYTGRQCERVVQYKLTGTEFGIAPGYCVLGF